MDGITILEKISEQFWRKLPKIIVLGYFGLFFSYFGLNKGAKMIFAMGKNGIIYFNRSSFREILEKVHKMAIFGNFWPNFGP